MPERQYYVYILASINQTLYFGCTNDIERRLYEHRTGTYGSEFSKKYQVHKLVYLETYTDVSLAIQREKQLKRWNRQKKIDLIEKNNQNWTNLLPY